MAQKNAANKPVVNPVTRPAEATKAAKVLSNPKSTKLEKSLAGATLVNAKHRKQT